MHASWKREHPRRSIRDKSFFSGITGWLIGEIIARFGKRGSVEQRNVETLIYSLNSGVKLVLQPRVRGGP